MAFAVADRLRSSSFTESGSKTEAALRAQLIELRRDLSTSQQEVEQTRLDLQQRQELLKSAAGRLEMRKPARLSLYFSMHDISEGVRCKFMRCCCSGLP